MGEREKRRVITLVATLQSHGPQDHQEAPTNALACSQLGHFKRIVLTSRGSHPDLVLFTMGITGKWAVPESEGLWVQSPPHKQSSGTEGL